MSANNNNLFSGSRLLWTPPSARYTRLEIFRRTVNRNRGLHLKNYYDLHKYSVEDFTFWQDLWDFLGIISSVPPTPGIEGIIQSNPSNPQTPKWFPGTRLNYAENLLHHNSDHTAVISSGESGRVAYYSYRQLREMVREMAAAMKVNGLQVGDRVAAIVTNNITAVVIALATASVGAIFSSTATDMGTQGVLDRYRQIKPKFIFAETEVLYAGKQINLLQKVREVVDGLMNYGLEHVVLLPSAISGKDIVRSGDVPKSRVLAGFLATDDKRPLAFEQLPFDHPLYILYSSGTSGPPKCIVHGAGGALLNSKKEISLNFDVGREDTYFQYTTTGWMMWPMMLTTLSCGATIVTYDGSPFHPDPKTFLKFIGEQKVTAWGTSPRFLTEIQGRGIEPLKLTSFESLRVICSTGAVLTPPMFEWAQRAFGPEVEMTSTSGGTDIFTAFVTCCPSLPVYAGEIPVKGLGMKVEVFDPDGKAIDETGEPGELVCTRPHVSLPIMFWGDEDGSKYRKAYYDVYPGIWRQGDFLAINPKTKGILMLGRSDGVLNPSGVRFGSAEIHAVLEAFSGPVDDSLCIGQRRPQKDKDERVLLFLKMRPGHKFTPKLVDEIKQTIKSRLSARHVPAAIFEIEDIPYTVNGKKIEIAVKQIVSGTSLKPSGTVANPESLTLYYKYRDIENFMPTAGDAKAKL